MASDNAGGTADYLLIRPRIFDSGIFCFIGKIYERSYKIKKHFVRMRTRAKGMMSTLSTALGARVCTGKLFGLRIENRETV